MTIATLCLVAALAAYTIWALVRIVRRRKAGGYCGCSSCASSSASPSRDRGGCPSCGQVMGEAKREQ